MKLENIECPNCGSKDVSYNEGENKYICNNCKSKYLNNTKTNLKVYQSITILRNVNKVEKTLTGCILSCATG